MGKILISNESTAYPMLLALDVNYVIVVFGGVTGYQSDDISKYIWPLRIGIYLYVCVYVQMYISVYIYLCPYLAREVYGDSVPPESQYRNKNGQVDIGNDAGIVFTQSILYKLCYYHYNRVQSEPNKPMGYDRARMKAIGM